MSLSRIAQLGALTLSAVLIAGCSTPAPLYAPALDNVEALKKSQAQPLAIGAFTVQAGATGANSIGLRGSSMVSPVGSDYAAYLAEALRQELALAGKLGPSSSLEISGVLLKNDISAAGFSIASGEIEARFVVKNRGETRYEAVKRGELSWESSFAGAIAIPKAVQQYPLVVQQLLKQLLADPAFQAAVR